jgi:hypothetical protein
MQDRPVRRAIGRFWWVIAALPYICGLVTLGVALRGNMGFPLDDSWIHQVIARNLVEFHSFGFTPGVNSSGSSSTLWTLLLALNYAVVPHVSPVVFSLALNAPMLIGCGVLLWLMASRDSLPMPEKIALAMLPGLSGNLIWLGFAGMEHIMFMFLSLIAILLWFREDKRARVAIETGLVLGLLTITRPEGLGLCVLLFVLYRVCGRSSRDVLYAAVIVATFFLPSLAMNLKTSGSLLPMTARGRLYMYWGTATLHVGRSSFRSLMLDTYKDVIARYFLHVGPGKIAIAAVVLAIVGLVVVIRRVRTRTAVLCLWAVLDYTAYCVTLPEPGHGGRYQPYVLLLFPGLMAIGAIGLWRGLIALAARRVSWATCAEYGLVVAAAVVTAMSLSPWKSVMHDGTAHINATHRQMAAWLNEHYAPDTKIGAFDIGAIGYFANVQLVDLGGLVDRNYLPYLVSGRVPDYLRERNVNYVILPQNGGESHFGDLLHLMHNPRITLIPIHTVENQNAKTWKNGFDYTGNAYRMQTLYRIVYLDKDRSGGN